MDSFQGLDALGAPHKQWDDHVREDDDIAQRQQGQLDGYRRQWCLSRHVGLNLGKKRNLGLRRGNQAFLAASR
jgi:hypothetical protein